MEKDTQKYMEAILNCGQMLNVYAAQIKSSMHAQSRIVEEALREFFKSHGVKIEVQLSPEDFAIKALDHEPLTWNQK
jgi:hypothetical protein